jgi:glycerophosphoryl diester phosphodiesterase
MGYNFQDPDDGSYPYRDLSDAELDAAYCRICTLKEVLDFVNLHLDGRPMNYIIEIKDSGDRGKTATDILYKTMLEYDILDKVIVGTFNQDITAYIDEVYQNRADGKNIIRSASISEVLSFYFSMMFNVDLSKQNIGYSVLQIPYRDFVINLGKPAIIEYAHSFGIAVQYWTINKEEDMRYLAESGADTIMTDNPVLLYRTIKTPAKE